MSKNTDLVVIEPTLILSYFHFSRVWVLSEMYVLRWTKFIPELKSAKKKWTAGKLTTPKKLFLLPEVDLEKIKERKINQSWKNSHKPLQTFSRSSAQLNESIKKPTFPTLLKKGLVTIFRSYFIYWMQKYSISDEISI